MLHAVEVILPVTGLGLIAAGDAMPLPGAEYVTTTGILMIVLWFVGRVVLGYLDTHAKREAERDKASVEDRKANQSEVREYQMLVKAMLESQATQLAGAADKYHTQATKVYECLNRFDTAERAMQEILERMSGKQEQISDLLHKMATERPCLLKQEQQREGAN